jgi:GNAT superfamily N-acetyltransferase
VFIAVAQVLAELWNCRNARFIDAPPGDAPERAERLRTRSLIVLPRIEKLQRTHNVDAFDCGREALNRFLVRFALTNQQASASQTYVALADDGEVVGYYTLVYSQVDYADAPERLTKGIARHPIPIMLLARLAVGTAWQGQGLGKGMLKDAVLRTYQAADIAGLWALSVHAKDDEARAFYERFDFIPSPADPYHLSILLKDLRALVAPTQRQ